MHHRTTQEWRKRSSGFYSFGLTLPIWAYVPGAKQTAHAVPRLALIHSLEANIVLKLCEYKGYSAIYAVIDYGFENSDVWEQTSEAWLNIKNKMCIRDRILAADCFSLLAGKNKPKTLSF